jgi:hypothetical protein
MRRADAVVILPILAQAATTIARASRPAGQLWELRRRIPSQPGRESGNEAIGRLERFGFILLSTQHGYRRRHGAALDV